MSENNEISRRTFIAKGAAAGGAVVLAGAAGSALAGCSSSSSSSSTTAAASSSKPGVGVGTPVRGGSLNIGLVAEIDGFYPPNNHWDTNGYLYAQCLYDPLMAIAADGSIQPYLAETCTPNSTFDTWTLTLRPNVKFHDGSALDATVVVNNFTALKASLLTGQALTQVTSCTATDPMTVVYKLQAPNPGFAAGLATQVGYVVAQAMIDQANAKVATPTPVGTGPFVYQDWQPNNHFTCTRNPNYWRQGLPYLDQITLRPIPDTIQREATLKTGGVDMIGSTDPDTINRFQGQSGYQVVDSATGRDRRAVDGVRHAQHGGGAHQRPLDPPGARHGAQPGHRPEDLRRRPHQAGQRPLPRGLGVLHVRHRLPGLRPRPGPRSWWPPTRPSTAAPPHSSCSPSPIPGWPRSSRSSSRCGSRSAST